MSDNNDNSGCALIFIISMVLSFFTALIHDAMNNNLGWLILEIVIFPIAVVRGYFIWLAAIF